MGRIIVGSHHVHMRKAFMHDLCVEHYERVYTACTIIPEKSINPESFRIEVLSEGLKNLQDPDYKNYRYKHISKRVIRDEDALDEFRKMANSISFIFSDPAFSNSYLVAHAMHNGVALPFDITDMLKLFEHATTTGDWKTYSSFSFSLVTRINQAEN